MQFLRIELLKSQLSIPIENQSLPLQKIYNITFTGVRVSNRLFQMNSAVANTTPPPTPREGTSGIGVKTTASICASAEPYGRPFWNLVSFLTGNVLFGHIVHGGRVQNSSGIAQWGGLFKLHY